MMTPETTTAPDPLLAAIDTIAGGLEKVLSGLASVRQTLSTPAGAAQVEFDPKDPRNKHEVGGLQKLTPRGVEICYRLFDRGLSRYAVHQAMDISFGAATHRYASWQKEGGSNRKKRPLD